jgi:hypothetical protein
MERNEMVTQINRQSARQTAKMVDKVEETAPAPANGNNDIALNPDPSLRHAEIVGTKVGPKVQNLLDIHSKNIRGKVARKAELLGHARQKLAESRDYLNKGDEESAKAKETSGQAALFLYQAQVEGVASANDVTGALGDSFGFKRKGKPGETVRAGHPEASKTPAGQGETIRKRVVRMFNAWDYVANDNADRFFDGLPKDKVEQIVREVGCPDPDNAGKWVTADKNIFTAYDGLSEIKREAANPRLPAALDSQHIYKLVDQLSDRNAWPILRGSESLIAGYSAIKDILTIVFSVPEEGEEAMAEAAE